MIRPFVSAIFVAALLVTGANAAQINVVNPYVRALPPGVPTSAAFMEIENPTDQPLVLVGAQTDIAGKAELHNHVSEGGVMKMRQVDEIEIPAKGKVALKPGGYHIMLFNLTASPKVGDEIAVTLLFSDQTTKTVKAKVKDLRKQDHHHHHH
ncbi:copper chaperone PCu(A)C [Corallincola platygyrae]|uniref:Copper chaperone PCu(A)C n=1 Tax=Corallincola platygyrae TaxID=1193278 RepID=A0ABW4XLH0_9GAMM